MELLEVEVLKVTELLPREPELAIEEVSAHRYLLADLGGSRCSKAT